LQFYQSRAVKYWNGSSWVGSQDFGDVKIWNGSAWQVVGIRPYADFALTTFSPDGGASYPGTLLTDSQYASMASVTISASASVVWNWTIGGGAGQTSVANGGSASSIQFYLPYTGFAADSFFLVNASTGAETKYWEVYLEIQSFD
jgi:hypothetical protein